MLVALRLAAEEEELGEVAEHIFQQTPRQNIPAYTGQVPASYGKPLGQSFGNAGRATILPGGYVGTGQWPPQQAGGGAPTGGGGGGGLPPPTVGGGYGGNPSAPGGPLSQPGGGYPATGGTVRGNWYGPNDPRNTVYAQGGFHGIIDKTMRFIAHANERVDISPGPRGQINREGIASAYRSEINEIVQSVRANGRSKYWQGRAFPHLSRQ